MLIEHFHQLGEVEQGTGQSINLVNHHTIDQTVLNI